MAKSKVMKGATREGLLAKLKKRAGGVGSLTPIEVPEWGMTVYLAELSGWDQEKIQEWVSGDKTRLRDTAKMLPLVLRDVDGKRLFEESEVGLLMAESSVLLLRLMKEAARLSGVDVEEEKKSWPEAASTDSNIN